MPQIATFGLFRGHQLAIPKRPLRILFSQVGAMRELVDVDLLDPSVDWLKLAGHNDAVSSLAMRFCLTPVTMSQNGVSQDEAVAKH